MGMYNENTKTKKKKTEIYILKHVTSEGWW